MLTYSIGCCHVGPLAVYECWRPALSLQPRPYRYARCGRRRRWLLISFFCSVSLSRRLHRLVPTPHECELWLLTWVGQQLIPAPLPHCPRSSVSASSSRRGSIADVLESWRNSRRHSSAKMRKLSCSHTLADLSEEKSLELLALLVRGVTIKKHYRADKMKQLRLWTSLTFDQLLWGRETEDGTALTVKGGVGVCEISDIVSYGGGCTFSSSFSEHATPSCCFSVVTARETLDAEMPSEIQRREILLALRYLVWLSHSPPSATGIRESFYFWWSQTPSDRNGLLRYGSAQAQIPTSRSVQETVRPGRRLSAPRSRFSSRGKETSTKAPGGGLEHIGVASPAAAQASPLASAASVSASGSTKRVPKGALQKLRITVVPPSLHEEDFSNKFQEFLNFKRAELEREFEEWQRATK